MNVLTFLSYLRPLTPCLALYLLWDLSISSSKSSSSDSLLEELDDEDVDEDLVLLFEDFVKPLKNKKKVKMKIYYTILC